jgi:nickel/cobalt transporter (NicO) family protein
MQRLIPCLIALLLVLALAGPVAAQAPQEPARQSTIDKRKLLVQPRNADGALQMVSFWEDPVLWARGQQQGFYAAMSGAMRQLKTGTPLTAAWTLMLLSFGYGVFHAAGPGHGKAVISSWLVATESDLRRGVMIAFMSAIIQALTAISIVSALFLIVASVGAAARNVAGVLESASYGLIGLMGLYLVWTALRPGHSHHNHDHDHDHHAESCGHSHAPQAEQLNGEWSLAKAFSLAFAVGIRPCTGAILVLVFANALGLYWAGIASTFAMAAGTFMTVAAIAALTVYAKRLALRLAAGNAGWVDKAGFALRMGGGLVIAILGAILFLGSLGQTSGMV